MDGNQIISGIESGIESGFDGLILKVVIVAVAVGVALLVQRVAVKVTRRAFEAADVPNASIFINILRALIWSLALLSILKPVFGVEPTWLVGALGVVSVAVSLGLQDTISNIIGGLGLMLSRSIKPGDVVEIGSTRGIVTDVTWRSTTLRTRVGDVDVIPNSVLNKTTLTHLDPANYGVCKVTIAIKPEAGLEAVAAEVREAVAEALGDDLNPAFQTGVFFSAIAAYGTEGTIHIHVKDNVTYVSAQSRVVNALHGREWLANAL